MSRNYESNGPDIKIRGNAAHIAEKYVQLARDATSVGDNVMAENYLQHAEHYFRIILAAQTQFQPRQDHASDSAQDDDGDETDTGVTNGASESTVAAEAGEAEANTADEQTERPRRQRRPRRERVEAEAEGVAEGAEPVKAEETEAAPAAEAAAEEEAPKRVRRPRRKKADEEAEAAPELPAFLTAGREAAAE